MDKKELAAIRERCEKAMSDSDSLDGIRMLAVHAHTDIPCLLAEVDRLRAEVEGMRAALADIFETLSETGGELCPQSVPILGITQLECPCVNPPHVKDCPECWGDARDKWQTLAALDIFVTDLERAWKEAGSDERG